MENYELRETQWRRGGEYPFLDTPPLHRSTGFPVVLNYATHLHLIPVGGSNFKKITMKLADIVSQTGDTLVSLTKSSATLAEVVAKAADAFAVDALASVKVAHMGNQIVMSGIDRKSVV